MRLVYFLYILMLVLLCACVAEVGERDNPFDEGADLTDYERDVSGWSDGSDGDVMRGNISGSCYVYEDGTWRIGNNLDCDLGLGGCIVSLQDSLRKGDGWYKCDTLTWRPASAIETDTAGWGKAKDGVVRAGQVNEGVHYIYEASEKAWRKATDIEKDTSGWGSSFKEAATKNGNVNTEKCYVFEDKKWRLGNFFDCKLDLGGCTLHRQDTVVEDKGHNWYICDSLQWRAAKDIEKDTVGWGAGAFDGEIRKGRINDTIYYIYEKGKKAWRDATTLEKDTYDYKKNKDWGAGSFDGEIRKGSVNDSIYYIYEKSIESWRNASTIEKDTYDYEKNRGWSVGGDGEIKKGAVTNTFYVYDDESYRIANAREIHISQGCTIYNEGVINTKSDTSDYICNQRQWVVYKNQFEDKRDNQIYSTVRIGKQIWMAQDLNYADSVESENIKGASWCAFGITCNMRYYNWSAAMNLSSNYQTAAYELDSKRDVCPERWHIPSREEWNELISFVGGIDAAWFSLKDYGTGANKRPTDLYGFSAKVNDGGTYGIESYSYEENCEMLDGPYECKNGDNIHFGGWIAAGGFWWSSSNESSVATVLHLSYIYDERGNGFIEDNKRNAYAVRCVKDEE